MSSSVSNRSSDRPLGLSPALAPDANEDWFRANRWPPQGLAALKTDLRTRSLGNAAVSFRPDDWSFQHFAVAATTEFAALNLGGSAPAWLGITIPPPPAIDPAPPAAPARTAIEDELAELLEIAEYRAGVMAEALEQRDNVLGYFRGLLTFKPVSHPWTVRLGHVATRVGQFLAMHHKMAHNRARPSRILPALMPPIDPPGHAAYPSGHATQAYLMALLLAQVMPGVAWGEGVGGAQETVTKAEATDNAVKNDITSPVRDLPGVADRMKNTPLWRIAERIARNREVLGVHYPSDSEAGLRLAAQALPILLKCSLINAPGSGAIDRAKGEWM